MLNISHVTEEIVAVVSSLARILQWTARTGRTGRIYLVSSQPASQPGLTGKLGQWEAAADGQHSSGLILLARPCQLVAGGPWEQCERWESRLRLLSVICPHSLSPRRTTSPSSPSPPPSPPSSTHLAWAVWRLSRTTVSPSSPRLDSCE